jgi:hypothetical protein
MGRQFTTPLEVTMQVSKRKPDLSTQPETVSCGLKDREADSAWNNPKRVARSIRASRARNESGRRRLVDPTTCERDYSAAEMEFMQAIQLYKQQSGRMFPTWSEVLEVLRSLGYQKSVTTELA